MMAFLMLSCKGLIAACAFSVITVTESGKFPLSGCSTDEMDIMFIYWERGVGVRDYVFQSNFTKQFVQHILSFPDNRTTSRVQFAHVIDRFSVHNPDVNVSSWRLHASLPTTFYGAEEPVKKQEYKNAQEAVELSITFLKRLFSEMGGVRESVAHIAVMFLNGEHLSYDERRSIPRFVQQQDTDIKIFVVVFSGKLENDTVYLSDTLFVTDQGLPRQVLTMVICNQCMKGWFLFEHSGTGDTLSCYGIFESNVPLNIEEAMGDCIYNQGGVLATIESKEELNFLQKTLYSYFISRSRTNNDSLFSQLLTQCHIALVRDLYEDKMFKWKLFLPHSYRPQVINHWLPGKPSASSFKERMCVVWKFVWNNHKKNITDLSRNTDGFLDGWTNVGCTDKVSSLSLCEVFLVRRIDDRVKLTIHPANKESFNKVLNSGCFMLYRDNIVSVSANIANNDFLKFIQKSGMEIPIFDCKIGGDLVQYVSYVYVCDSIDHCSNRRDETSCRTKQKQSPETSGVCPGFHCCGSCLTLQWVSNGEPDCPICACTFPIYKGFFDINNYLSRNKNWLVKCNVGECVQRYDDYSECPLPDALDDVTIGDKETADPCYYFLNQSIWAPRCVYVRDNYGSVLGCKDMSHLENCTEFQCPEGYVKCLNSYCIPQHYVRDRQTDCPTGEDEQIDSVVGCTGNFACWDSEVCLHPYQVCNGRPNCPHQDDEVDCQVPCGEGFHCVSGTVTVSTYNRSIPLTNTDFIYLKTKYIDLSGIDLSAIPFSQIGDPFSAQFMFLSHCKIYNVSNIERDQTYSFQVIDLSNNLIKEVDGSEIELNNIRMLNFSHNTQLAVVKNLQFTFLETLDLSHTSLSNLDESSLVRLPNLKHLDLSYTQIVTFRSKSFLKLILETLDVRGLTFENVYEDYFNGLTINQHLYTDNFELCCPQIRGNNIPYHTCHAPDNAISSCFDLVGVNVQRVLLWVVAVLAVLGNMAVIVYRVIYDRAVLRTGYGLFVTNLSISDFSIGVYLLIIVGADYYYRGNYILYDKTWRESITCKLAGFVATLSSETSIFFIFLITLDRFLIMKFPFGQMQFSKLMKIVVVCMSWIIGFLFALTPVVFGFEIYSSNAMCLGLPLTTKRLKGWDFSFGVFIVLNFFLCLIITLGQRAIFRVMSENRIPGTASSTSPRRAKDIIVAKQLSLVAMSNFLCWFPVGFMGFLSLGGKQISNDVYAWTTVIVLPVNSAANPFLYTIPALIDKWEKFKHGKTSSH